MRSLQLNTPRLLIDALQAQDGGLFCALFTDKRAMQFIGEPLTPARAAVSFQLALRRNAQRPLRHLLCRIIERTTGSAIGLCSIQRIDRTRRTCEIGLMLTPRRHGSGLGHETVIALIDAAFRVFPIGEISVQYRADNAAAERLFISAGFRPGAREGADGAGARMRLLFAYRHAWSPPGSAHQLGVHACQT
jgi:RimJ/RimL family protein N-acetyltransferase